MRSFGKTVFVASLMAAAPLQGQRASLTLATTTSVRDAGLLDAILPPFEERFGRRVRVVAVGSGQALALGRRGEADLLLLHEPYGEAAFMADGLGIARIPLMYNHFVLLAPPTDPAAVRGAGSIGRALGAIARSGAPFVSRGDGSGTHVKERELWRAASTAPDPKWYRETGQGMSATLQVASELGAYTLSDIGTFFAHRGRLALTIVLEADSALVNPYHLVLPHPDRFPQLNAAGARALIDYLRSPETRRRIADFGVERNGRWLFRPW